MNSYLRSFLVVPALLMGIANATPSLADAPPPSSVRTDGHNNWTVAPTGRSPDDAAHIQWAVDHAKPGADIHLGAGVFDFGDFDGVNIPKDLTIEGAWDNNKNTPLTTIKGGMMPLNIGRKAPVQKPDTVTIKGHKVYHITQDLYGKFTFPFLYPPYYNAATGQQTGAHYDIFADWTPVDVSVRQISFERPYGSAIFVSGMKGGTIERCRFVSAWPLQIDIQMVHPLGSAIMFLNMGASPDIAADWGVQSDPSLYSGTSLIRGNLVVQNNVIEGDTVDVAKGQRDANGRLLIAPFASNPTPPGGDYDNYVLQDVAKDGISFNLNPASPQPQYWVRKGYTAWSPDQVQVFARRGQMDSVYSLYAESTLTVKDNTFRNSPMGIVFILNGMKGKAFNAIVDGNTFTENQRSITGIGTQAISVWDFPLNFDPSPGTNVSIKNNVIDQVDTAAGFLQLAIDVEVYGKASITNNTVKVNGGSGIGFWWPTQNGVAKDNRISGAGDYAFYTLMGTNGNQFINNHVDKFAPTGPGANNTDIGNPIAGPARGVLFSDNNTVKGIGPATPLDVVINCGQNNVIQNMIAQPCPPAAAIAAPQAAGTPSQPLLNLRKFMGWRVTR